MRARHGRTRVAPGRRQNAERIYLPGQPLRFIDPGNIDKLSGDGSTSAIEVFLCDSGELDHRRKAVLLALKKYGAIVADNGSFFSVSVCPDDRFSANAFSHLSTIDINNFEVIQTTGPTGGPRSPGAPSVDAGADQYVDLAASATLSGAVNDPSGTSAIQWKLYGGPGPVNFTNANAAVTNVTFSKIGSYTFLLSADDAIHAVAYDAVIVTVRLPVALAPDHADLLISFPSVAGQAYRLEQKPDLSSPWTIAMNNINGTGAVITLRMTNALAQARGFYRVAEADSPFNPGADAVLPKPRFLRGQARP